ncbi:hypothetical protein B0H13DRAFT_2319815 [Mycena leptocephala]|nr:hypothetical protein B0H13DRAFT_2319815 [Mycena leptocephala]
MDSKLEGPARSRAPFSSSPPPSALAPSHHRTSLCVIEESAATLLAARVPPIPFSSPPAIGRASLRVRRLPVFPPPRASLRIIEDSASALLAARLPILDCMDVEVRAAGAMADPDSLVPSRLASRDYGVCGFAHPRTALRDWGVCVRPFSLPAYRVEAVWMWRRCGQLVAAGATMGPDSFVHARPSHRFASSRSPRPPSRPRCPRTVWRCGGSVDVEVRAAGGDGAGDGVSESPILPLPARLTASQPRASRLASHHGEFVFSLPAYRVEAVRMGRCADGAAGGTFARLSVRLHPRFA